MWLNWTHPDIIFNHCNTEQLVFFLAGFRFWRVRSLQQQFHVNCILYRWEHVGVQSNIQAKNSTLYQNVENGCLFSTHLSFSWLQDWISWPNNVPWPITPISELHLRCPHLWFIKAMTSIQVQILQWKTKLNYEMPLFSFGKFTPLKLHLKTKQNMQRLKIPFPHSKLGWMSDIRDCHFFFLFLWL